MNLQLTYILHSCFLLREGNNLFLFDWSDLGREERETEKIIKAQISPDDDLYILNSHVHFDHFSPSVLEFSGIAKNTYFLIGQDIAKAHPDFLPDNLVVASANQKYQLGSFTIETPLANDSNSICFLFNLQGEWIYFGADLARWNWPKNTEAENKEEDDFFFAMVERLQKLQPLVAFSNVDQRMPCLSGGKEFVEMVKPKLFVPLHTFGQEGYLGNFASSLAGSDSSLFIYCNSGDQYDFYC